MYGGSENSGYSTENEENQIIKILNEMGFPEQQIRSTATEFGIEINSSEKELLTDILLQKRAAETETQRFSQQSSYLRDQSETSYVSPSGHKAVQIILPGQTNSYAINNKEIERIFSHPDVANTPVAIYSVAGAFRKGKSFILNFFLLFCGQKITMRWQSESWLHSKQRELDRGFGWRGGSVQHTQGIWIWDEPFFLKTRYHDRVAVFLMDTQGSFEPGAAVKDCSVIFALSTLISSVQIYNVSQNIQEDTLQHLQLFTEYGKVAKKMHQEHGKSFQDLIFLVRDWADPAIPYGFDGGSQLLDRVVYHVQLDHQDIKSVRNNLRDSFEHVSCFLMPNPGDKVAVRSQAQGDQLNLKDVKQNFKDMVDVLVRQLFSSDKLVVKQISNNLVTGKDLINLTTAYFEIFRSGKMPEVGTIMETTAKAAIVTIIQEIKNVYRRQMKLSCENTYKSDEEMKNTHDLRKKEALDKFDQKPKFGDDSFIEKYRKNLEELMNQEFDVYKQINEAEKERMKHKVQEAVTAAEVIYTNDLEDCSGGQFVDESSICEIEKVCRETAVDSYLEQTTKFPRETVEEYKRKLIELLDQAWSRFNESNYHKREELRRQLEDKSIRAMQQYRRSMDASCSDLVLSDEVFEEAHQAGKAEALDGFEESDVGQNTDLRENMINRFIQQVEEEKAKYRSSNLMNRKIAQAETRETLNESKNQYKRLMEETCDMGYIEAERLQQTHLEAKEQAKAFISSVEDSKGSEFVNKCKAEVDEFLNNEFGNFQRRNETWKQIAISSLKQRKLDAYERYQQKIDCVPAGTFVDERSLKALHDNEKKRALTYYRGNKKEPRIDFEKIENKLENEIEKHYQLVCEKNQENKKRAEEMAMRVLQEIKTVYLKHMMNVCDGKYVAPLVLQSEHVKIKSMIENEFRRHLAVNNEELLKKIMKRFENEVEELFKTIKENNEKNERTWIRRAVNVAAETAQGALAGLALSPPGFKLIGACIGALSGLIGSFLK